MALPPFQRVLDVHADRVLRYLTAALGPVDADDAFQETFIAALRAYPKLRADANVRAWLLTIARNKALDAHRARTRRPTPVEHVPERPAPWANGPLVDLTSIIDVKSTRARDVLFLRYAADLSHAEIAQVLGCTEVASRRAAADGLADLRRAHRSSHSPAGDRTTTP